MCLRRLDPHDPAPVYLGIPRPLIVRYDDRVMNRDRRADAEDKHDFVYANTMAITYGERIYFSIGFDCNIKLTTKEDLAFYKAMKQFSEEELTK